MRTFLFIGFTAICTLAYPQLLDSIKNSFKYKPVFLIKLDAKNSFISSYRVKTKGVKAGLNFNNTTKIGIGYSWLSSDYLTLYNADTVSLKINSFSAFIEYNFFKSKHFYAEIPVHVGVGRLNYLKETDRISSAVAIFYEPAMTIEYRFFRYLGLGFGAGYRFVLHNHSRINEKLTSPIYIFRFKVYFGDIYKKHIKK